MKQLFYTLLFFTAIFFVACDPDTDTLQPDYYPLDTTRELSYIRVAGGPLIDPYPDTFDFRFMGVSTFDGEDFYQFGENNMFEFIRKEGNKYYRIGDYLCVPIFYTPTKVLLFDADMVHGQTYSREDPALNRRYDYRVSRLANFMVQEHNYFDVFLIEEESYNTASTTPELMATAKTYFAAGVGMIKQDLQYPISQDYVLMELLHH